MAETEETVSELSPAQLDQAADAVILAMMADNNFSRTEAAVAVGKSPQEIRDVFEQDLIDATGPNGANGDNIRLTSAQREYALDNYEFVAGVGYDDDPSTEQYDGEEQITILRRKSDPNRSFDSDGGGSNSC